MEATLLEAMNHMSDKLGDLENVAVVVVAQDMLNNTIEYNYGGLDKEHLSRLEVT